MAKPAILILGGPCSGKGEQSQRVARWLGTGAISTGEELRRRRQAGTLDPNAATIMERGGLVPESVFENVLMDAIAAVPAEEYLVLDGVAKKGVAEAKWLLDYLARQDREVLCGIYLDIDQATFETRSQERSAHSHRADDKSTVLVHRWQEFITATWQSIDYLRAYTLVFSIDGNDHPDAVFIRIQNLLSREIVLSAVPSSP